MFYMNRHFKCEMRPECVISTTAWWGQHRATIKITKPLVRFYDVCADTKPLTF